MNKTLNALIVGSVLSATFVSGSVYAQDSAYYKTEIDKATAQYEAVVVEAEVWRIDEKDFANLER